MSFSERIIAGVLPLLASWGIRFLALTMRMSYVHSEFYRRCMEENLQFILAFWHGRLLMMPIGYNGRPITVLVSRHRDGELVARTVRRFSIESSRGSTTRGWFAGLKGLLIAARDGRNMAITPDGPNGPRFKAQMGVIQIAEKTGLPIVPMSFGASKKKIFSSWDAFLLPYPFSKGVFITGEPIFIEKNAGEEELERRRLELETSLNEITRKADGFFE